MFTGWLSSNGIGLITLVLGSSVITAVVSRFFDSGAASAQARREGYARAVRVLVARHEYPYRIRRRTADDPAVLGELVKLGHDIQEDLAAAQAWVAAESGRMGQLYRSVLANMDVTVGPACREAWDFAAVTEPAHMNLAGWGPASSKDLIGEFQDAAAWRFGIRRVIPTRLAVRRIVRGDKQALQRWPRTAPQRRPQAAPAKPAP